MLRLAQDGARVAFLDIDEVRGRACAAELRGQGFDATCIHGWTRTAAVEDWSHRQPDPAAAKRQAIGTQPLRRIASRAEAASVAAFLVSDEASAITGAGIPLDRRLGAKNAG